jgi:thiol-disulfide isomerase/thioredoxin
VPFILILITLCAAAVRGAEIDPFKAHKDAKALVFIFVSNECPVANRYAPEMERLHKQYASNQIAFILVHADPSETQASIDKHTRDFGFTCEVLRDADQRLARKAGVKVTPEAAVFLPNGKRVYRGRIDNRQADFGKARPEPSERDLQAALDAIVQGKSVPKPETRAIGCYIPFPR